MERLQKILARAGVASRREAERWILEGRVSINGAPVRQLGVRADPLRDSIKVDGKRIKAAGPFLYFALHKPPGIVATLRDPRGRPDLRVLLEGLGKRGRLFPVGRLDFNTSGLLLLTNDGEIAQRLTHPRFGVRKKYRAKLSACPLEQELDRVRRGIRLEDGVTLPARARVVQKLKKNAWVEIEIREGRYREVRRIFAALGYFVEKLIRVQVGPICLGTLAPGEIRPLSEKEIRALKGLVAL